MTHSFAAFLARRSIGFAQNCRASPCWATFVSRTKTRTYVFSLSGCRRGRLVVEQRDDLGVAELVGAFEERQIDDKRVGRNLGAALAH